MKRFELLVETVKPCGSELHRQTELLEVMAESTAAYVKEHALWPVLNVSKKADGSVRYITSDGHGNQIRYTFTES